MSRIEKYVHKSDIVLLPLEWQYYSYEKPADIFLNAINHHKKLIKYKSTYLKEHIEKFNNEERGHNLVLTLDVLYMTKIFYRYKSLIYNINTKYMVTRNQ